MFDLKDINGFTSVYQFIDSVGLDEFQSRLVVSCLVFIFFIVAGWIINHVFEHYFKRWAKKTKTKIYRF